MLDSTPQSSYVEAMTYYRKPHPPIYYKIRTVVRVGFWGSVAVGVTSFASWFAQLDDKPECPITLNSDFTYDTHSEFDPTKCSAGHNVTLIDDHHWGWTD